MAANYILKLPYFEGPLDLLLHLIKLNELNIFDIDLLILTTQYLTHLRLIEFKDIKDAATFLEMAATLLELKSARLLPQEKAEISSLFDISEEEDEGVLLQKRLLLLDTFKKVAEYFASHEFKKEFTVSNFEWQRLDPQFEDIESPLIGDPHTLCILYEQLLSSLSERRPVTVKANIETITLEEIISKITTLLFEKGSLQFLSLFSTIKTRYELIASILAVLQMVRDGNLKIHQEDHLGTVWLYKKDEGGQKDDARSI